MRLRRSSPRLAGSVALLATLAPAQSPSIHVRNPHVVALRTIVRASVPWPRGVLHDPARIRVAGAPAAAVPLLRWPDGSLQVVQVQFEAELPAAQETELPVELAAQALPPPPARAWMFPASLPLVCELRDPWDRAWHTTLEPDPHAAAGGLVVATQLVEIRRLLGPLRDGSGAALLDVVAYLTRFAGERHAELTLLLGNGASPHGSAPAVGPVRFRSFALIAADRRLRARPHWIGANLLERPQITPDGGWRQQLLGPSDQLYLGDRTGKAWRFDLFWDEQADDAARERADLLAGAPPVAFADLDWTRHTRAWSVHGGPAPALAPGFDPSADMIWQWQSSARFGPFGGFGDAEDPLLADRARETPFSLHNVLRTRSPSLLGIAEAIVLQQPLRPTPGCVPRLPADTAAFRAAMPEHAIERPHGWVALGYEHFAVDLLYDWFWLTGDPLARDELARCGSGLPALLAGVPFRTARGEGLCLRAGVQIAQATGDEALFDLLLRHAHALLPQLGRAPSAAVLPQPGHARVFGTEVPFDAPWQLSLLVRGLHALHVTTGDLDCAAAAVQIADAMAGPGWVDGVGPKTFVSARDPGRYILADDQDPLTTTRAMSIGAYVLAAELTSVPAAQELFLLRAGFLARGWVHAPEFAHADPWLQLWFDRRGDGR